MDLFSRTVTLAGPVPEVMAYATGMRQLVSDKTGADIALWSALFGAPTGTMTYAVRVEGLSGLAAMTSSFVDDAEYHAKAAQGRDFLVAPAEDQLLQLIHGELGEATPPVGAVATVTVATAAGGFGAAAAWGVEVAQIVESVTGSPVLFGSGIGGTVGQFAWVGVNADFAAADEAGAALAQSADYMAKLEEANGLFVPGGSNRTMSVRAA